MLQHRTREGTMWIVNVRVDTDAGLVLVKFDRALRCTTQERISAWLEENYKEHVHAILWFNCGSLLHIQVKRCNNFVFNLICVKTLAERWSKKLKHTS